MSTTRSRAAKRPRTQTPAPANPAASAASGVLVGSVSGDEAVRMLQRMHQMDHLHDLHMYAPDDNGGLQLVTAHRLVMAAASERLEKTVARREGGFKEGQAGAEVYFDRGKFKGTMDACELRAIVSYAYGDAELRVMLPPCPADRHPVPFEPALCAYVSICPHTRIHDGAIPTATVDHMSIFPWTPPRKHLRSMHNTSTQ